MRTIIQYKKSRIISPITNIRINGISNRLSNVMDSALYLNIEQELVSTLAEEIDRSILRELMVVNENN